MDFGKIVNNSFKIAWEHKSLWILGLFAGGSFSGFHWDLGDVDFKKYIDLDSIGMGRHFWDNMPPLELLIIPLVLFILLFLLFLFIMHLICVPAIIDGVNKIARGGYYSLGGSLKAGLHYFWRFLGLFLLSFFATGLSIALLVLVGIVFFTLHLAVGLLSLLVLIPMFFFIIIAVTNIYSLTQRSMVVRDISIGDALEEGFYLFRSRFLDNLLIFLIYIGLTIGLGLAAAIIWVIVGLPIGFIVMAMGVSLVPAIIVGMILGLPISFVVGGFLGTVFANLYTLFYFELVEPGGVQQPMPAPAG
ncbi:MAG: hypothetical protein JXA92_04235 [candidate division Zixibacteria bacterium]|nr:hypothetical protein [candidate division Zixibacteria bacterium]